MNIKYRIVIFLSLSLLIAACHSDSGKRPAISFEKYKIENGFEIQLAASEPSIEAPVAMDFDNRGRMWVVQMRGYMPNLAGVGEDVPNGRISIVEDEDKDGYAEKSSVFLDSLVLPRAVANVYGGLLYAAPPNLWFVEINNDKPGKKILVDSVYSDGGNPENQPNGLIMGIDNWIYSANSNFRYQLNDGKWIKEPTTFRGQWGIAKDNFGRLYYNYNEIQLAGDYVLPNTFINNPYLKPAEAINKILTENQRVYPLHPTTVNRGYVVGVLNKDSLLVNFTAACGPLIYRGNQFPNDYSQNAFVCEPEANLIKRNILTFGPLSTTARQVWDDREFIASADEGFRPVNVLHGPDGAMYVVDMHRGIMQHRADETPYYRNGIGHKKLDTLLHKGRILRIKYKNNKLEEIPDFNKVSANQLVTLLKNDNGWVRDRAQQLLIYKQEKSAIPQLQALISGKNALTAVHALHTLDGLHALSFDLLKAAAASADAMLSSHALVLLEKYSSNSNIDAMAKLANDLFARNDSTTNLYLALSLGPWANTSKETFLPILARLSQKYAVLPVYQEAIVSSLKGMEQDFQKLITKSGDNNNSQNQVINNLLTQTIKNKQEKKVNSIFVQIKIPIDDRQNGLVLYRSTCSGCHGPDGEGIQHVAPPLNGSEYIAGTTARLGMIILNGLEGPIHVNGQLYKFNQTMPTFGNNFSDKEIAGIIDYLHNSFVAADPKLSFGRKPVKDEEIKNLRNKRTGTLTEADLLKMANMKE